ncbi:MAG TPA: PEP-CTERM system histidine kinase PrsK [Rubrivivax sp.]|nr:PEP-CTERM system histidine kinase PrsK [Rubrivivax sp.]
MDDTGFGLTLIGYLLAALGYAALGVYLLRRGTSAVPGARLPWTVLLAVAASLVWAIVGAWDEVSVYTVSSYTLAGVDVLRYVGWLAVLLGLLAPVGAGRAAADAQPALMAHAAHAAHAAEGVELRTLAGRFWLLVVALALVAAFLLWQRIGLGQYEPGASRPFLLLMLSLPVLGLLLVEQVFRNLDEGTRWAARPVMVGLAALFAFDVFLFAEGALLGRLDEDVLAIRPLAHLVPVPLLFIAARRRADWVQGIEVSRRAVFYSTSLLLAGGYLLFLSAVGYYVRYFGGEWGRALQFALLFAGLVGMVLLVLSASLRARVRVFIAKHFYSYRYDYRDEWLAFTAMLASDTAPQEVGVRVVRALANIVECPAGSLWTLRDDEQVFRQAVSWNMPPSEQQLPAQAPLAGFLDQKAWIVDLEEYRRKREAYGELVLPEWLAADARLWVIVPLHAASQLLGFVALAPPRTPVELNWETRDLLKTASRQAAGYLAQMRATEALLEARKFDAFNRMSAFVVHDLKNIVTQLSLMLKNARRLRDNPEFQEDMLTTVESSLEKMRRMMLQLREGVAPPGGTRGVAMSAIVQKLQALARHGGRQIETKVTAELFTRGHEERLERVLGHLVQNALDATPASGRVWVEVARHSGQLRVEIGDTGHGMSEEFVRTRLFKPFSSTKGSGMGIGSYESAQYIRELGGSIEVDSREGQGTVLTVLLPLLEVGQSAELPVSAS